MGLEIAWEAGVARILRIRNLLHESNGKSGHGSVEVYLDLFLGSSSPCSYTFGSFTLPPDVPAHTCATKHLSCVHNCSNARPLSLQLFEAVGVRCDSCWLCSANVTSGAVLLHTGASSPTLPV